MSSALNKSNPRLISLPYLAMRQAAILIIIYVALLFLLPTSVSTFSNYHLSMLEYKTVRFAISLPTLLVWLAAFFGYAALRQYARSIKDTPEGEHFTRLAKGCAWLAWSLPVISITSLILSSLAYEWPAFHGASVILLNYASLLLPLIAFSIIGMASDGLLWNAKLNFNRTTASYIIVAFLTAGVLYCYLTFLHFDHSNFGSTDNPYYLPIWLMVLTVIIPYLYAWFVGLLAAYEITLLSKNMQGVLYKHGLQWLVAGLVTIIISSIVVQYINAVEPRSVVLIFDYRLVFSLLFRITGGIGFLLLAWGALKLKKIEEV
ncbi:MAG TPA: hypothetical protein VH234_01745 [Candidatus Saccharimonadales bacterium]|jgi:hypothetical protein|nr:hypothetical protein [Candidatus Saccharimonadales bacterium]